MAARTYPFSLYLTGLMKREGFDELSLSKEMGFRTLVPVTSWIDCRALPWPSQLPSLAKVLNEDLITMAMGWLMAQDYDLERPIRREILEPRGVNYPDPI